MNFEVGQRVRDIGSDYTKDINNTDYIPVGSIGTAHTLLKPVFFRDSSTLTGQQPGRTSSRR